MPNLTANRLRELLDYDQDTGKFFWKVNLRGPVRKGSIAGTTNGKGYRQIRIEQKIYPAARLAFLWITGRWPRNLIDHINCVKCDDRWENLREATYSQNAANTPDRISGSPLKGVTWDKGRQRYAARIRVKYKMINLGRFETPQAAHAAYVVAAKKHFGSFAREA